MRDYRREFKNFNVEYKRRVATAKCNYHYTYYSRNEKYLDVWAGRDYSEPVQYKRLTDYYGFRLSSEPVQEWTDEVYDGLFYSGDCGSGKQYAYSNYLAPGYATLIRPYKIYKNNLGEYRVRPDIDPRYVSQAISQLDAKLRADTINLGISVGESRQTLQFIADTMSRVLRAYAAFKRKQWNNVAYELGLQNIKDLAGNYVAFIFGVKPLLNDINNAITEVKDSFNRPDYISIKTTAVGDYKSAYHGTWEISGDMIEGCQMGYNLKIVDKTVAALNAIGLANPLAIAWELVPFSFIINWFVPIGNMLSSLTTGAGMQFVTGYRTDFKKGVRVLTPRDEDARGYWVLKTFAMERTILDSFSAAGLYVRYDLTLDKLFTMMALGVALSEPSFTYS